MVNPMAKGTWGNPWAGGWPAVPPAYMMGQMPYEYSPWMGVAKPEKPPKAEQVVEPASKSRTTTSDLRNESVKQFTKTKFCSFFQKGLCTRGENCTFAHCHSELEVSPDLEKTSICLAWKAGTCHLSGQDCRFAHGKTYLRSFTHKQSRQRLQKLGRDLLDILGKGESNEELGVDDLLLMKLEEREAKEIGADKRNEETFGADIRDDWNESQVLQRSQDPALHAGLPDMPPPPPPPTASSVVAWLGGLPDSAAGLPTDTEVKLSAPTVASTSSGDESVPQDSDSDWGVEISKALASSHPMTYQ